MHRLQSHSRIASADIVKPADGLPEWVEPAGDADGVATVRIKEWILANANGGKEWMARNSTPIPEDY